MSSISYLDIGNLGAAFIEVKVGEEISTVQGEGTQPPSLPLSLSEWYGELTSPLPRPPPQPAS